MLTSFLNLEVDWFELLELADVVFNLGLLGVDCVQLKDCCVGAGVVGHFWAYSRIDDDLVRDVVEFGSLLVLSQRCMF